MKCYECSYVNTCEYSDENAHVCEKDQVNTMSEYDYPDSEWSINPDTPEEEELLDCLESGLDLRPVGSPVVAA